MVTSFSVRSATAGTPIACNHHLETVSVLFYLLEEDSHHKSLPVSGSLWYHDSNNNNLWPARSSRSCQPGLTMGRGGWATNIVSIAPRLQR
jgi:hypothetical protein